MAPVIPFIRNVSLPADAEIDVLVNAPFYAPFTIGNTGNTEIIASINDTVTLDPGVDINLSPGQTCRVYFPVVSVTLSSSGAPGTAQLAMGIDLSGSGGSSGGSSGSSSLELFSVKASIGTAVYHIEVDSVSPELNIQNDPSSDGDMFVGTLSEQSIALVPGASISLEGAKISDVYFRAVTTATVNAFGGTYTPLVYPINITFLGAD